MELRKLAVQSGDTQDVVSLESVGSQVSDALCELRVMRGNESPFGHCDELGAAEAEYFGIAEATDLLPVPQAPVGMRSVEDKARAMDVRFALERVDIARIPNTWVARTTPGG